MRGLKPNVHQGTYEFTEVASFTDAWIETSSVSNNMEGLKVASFTDAWIETLCHLPGNMQEPSHLLQMRGLKQERINNELLELKRRIFYRCVD